MRRVPWRWGLLFVTASVAINVTFFSIDILSAYGQFSRSTDLATYLRFAWRSTLVGLWLLLVMLALGTYFALGRTKALTTIRTELAGRSRAVPIVTAVAAFFVVAPALVALFSLGFALIVDAGQSYSPPGKVRVENDLGSDATITFCPKQDCGGQSPRLVHSSDHVDYRIQRSRTPDSIVVQYRRGMTRSGLLDQVSETKGAPAVSLSEETDAETCGADVDSMDAR